MESYILAVIVKVAGTQSNLDEPEDSRTFFGVLWLEKCEYCSVVALVCLKPSYLMHGELFAAQQYDKLDKAQLLHECKIRGL